jgi:hypothetical protein
VDELRSLGKAFGLRNSAEHSEFVVFHNNLGYSKQ